MGSSFLLYYLGFDTYKKTAIDKKTSVILDE